MNKHTHRQMRSVHNAHQTFISGRAFLFDQDQFIHLPAPRLSTYAWRRLYTSHTKSTLNHHFASLSLFVWILYNQMVCFCSVQPFGKCYWSEASVILILFLKYYSIIDILNELLFYIFSFCLKF